MKTILVLYSEVMGYNLPCFRELVKNGFIVHCVYWDHKKNTPFLHDNEEGIFFYPRSYYDKISLLNFSKEISPALILVSGWMDKDYLHVCKFFKKNKIPVVSGLDNWWKGSLKQILVSFFSWYFIKPYFSWFFSPGKFQDEFINKLGYKNKKIKGLYTCDVSLFQNNGILNIQSKTIIFVGRYVKIKGIDIFIKSFDSVKEKLPNWKFHLYGNGELFEYLKTYECAQIKVNGFLNPEDLAKVFREATIFCLPSLHEPWGLVIHEATCSGLPLLTSNNIGSCTEFLEVGKNGFDFDIKNPKDIENKILSICNLESEKLIQFSEHSKLLSRKRSPQIWCENILSVL
ncbi:MAG: glycosyltransferase [Cytophagales bacterium]